jgi:membrane protease YdiL (CAAX protease family)
MEPEPIASTGLATTPLPPPVLLPQPRRLRRVFILLGPLLGAFVLGTFIKGELGHFFAASWEVAVFAVLCVLGYVGLDHRLARIGSWLLLFLLLAGGVCFNLMLTVWALLGRDGEIIVPNPLPEVTLFSLASVVGLSVLAALTVLPARARAWRRLCGPEARSGEWTSVRTLALATVSAITLLGCVPLLVLGEPPFLLIVGHSGADFLAAERGAVGMHLDALYSLSWTLMVAALAVGYGVRRDWPETLERLGLRRISKRQFAVALGFTALLVGVMYGVDLGITRVWQFFHWSTTDVRAFTALMAPLINPIGAMVIGITAGVGEEIAVRGILQPRLGIFLSNALFTAVHAYQYGWDALVSVFLTGLVLGVVRKKTNTTVCVVIHGSYDVVLVLSEYFWGSA